MKRLRRVDGAPGEVFLLGSGTIGGEIIRHLRRSGMELTDDIVVPWSDTAASRALFSGVFGSLSGGPVDLVWAAGAAGFAADDGQVATELASYGVVIESFRRGVERSSAPASVHMVSSAGGLFEGLHVSTPDRVPEPQRPYGRLKLEQEHVLRDVADGLAVHLHRPSSVYTDPRPLRRPGLIGALLGNGRRRSPTPIVGSLDTLRDYVHARDVGRFIAHRVVDGDRTPGVTISFLVNGEPASIHRVIETVQRVLRRKLLIQFREAWNAADITFSNSVRAPGFSPMGVSEGTAVTFVSMEQAADLF